MSVGATSLLTEGDVDRGRPVSRELRPDFCCHGHRSRLIGWEPGHGLYYACQVPGCPSVQYRY
jgi:hypothetical protein